MRLPVLGGGLLGEDLLSFAGQRLEIEPSGNLSRPMRHLSSSTKSPERWALSRGGDACFELGAIFTMCEDRICAVDFCDRTAAACLAQQVFCINHFIDLCYENLQRIDPRCQKADRMPLDLPTLRAFVEECSRSALDVALHCEELDNLQRGRLLDILLWAGELFVLLRAPRSSFADSILPESDPILTRLAARHF